MKRKKLISIVPTVTLLIGLLVTTTASAVGPCCLFCQKGRCHVEVDIEEVEIKGFDVECEAICIPPLRFPWEGGPLKKCGKVRCVKKLVGDKKTCKVCTYDWEAIVCCPDCRTKLQRCGSSCGDGPCCEGGSCCDTFGCDALGDSPCGPVRCCADNTLPATQRMTEHEIDIAIDDAIDDAIDEPQVADVVIADVMVAEIAAPEVTVALVHAIGQAKPDADGWVRVTNLSSTSLSAEDELIE